MTTWIFVAALALVGLTGKSALASQACGPWGGEDTRCIGNNSDEGPGSRKYTITVKPKGNIGTDFRVVIWRSLCGFPGVITKIVGHSAHAAIFPISEDAGHLQCVEFFITACKRSSQVSLSCADAVTATIDSERN